ncbi:hypothetical protein AWJ20_2569 [Sugiyamaella lignohabitans]|uniref:Uncharacterized protein n=1 Tax=Sugiyamaella lignohabitans TaxID=796027 RepID=A0A167F8F8_9ASCO|nr:uncharacterized protein AWJ20_2569 [Sugiyamaella lignohabitans]ANB14952.1 hypothetical protein AWJ20_2569 [Sugiyamaella lignohabitans]
MVAITSLSPLVLLVGSVLAQSCTPSSQGAAIASNLASIQSACTSTDSLVRSFTSSQGLLAALNIQTSEQNIQSAVNAAITNAGALSAPTACDEQVIVAALLAAAPSITQLLSDITSKQADFNAVGVSSIIVNDLTSLQSGTFKLESQVYAKVPCSALTSAKSSLTAINNGFASALTAYGASGAAAPVSPC